MFLEGVRQVLHPLKGIIQKNYLGIGIVLYPLSKLE